MKIHSISFFVMFGLLICFSSCQEAFETTLTIDPPPFEKQLVVHAYGNSRTHDLEVTVIKSVGLLERAINNSDQIINDATVTLISGDDEYVLQNSAGGSSAYSNYYLPEGILTFDEGESYVLKVEADGFPDVTASTIVPPKVNIRDFNFEVDGPSDGFDDYSAVEFVLEDQEEVDNYYEAFFLEVNVNGSEFPTFGLYSLDPVLEEGFSYSSLLLNDDSFDGSDKSVQLLLDKFFAESQPDVLDRLYLAWREIPRELYLYSKSANQNRNNEDNPFASPVQVFSNIENGIGVFAIFNERIIKVTD